MDASLGPVTIGGFLSCLRGFLRYLRDVRGLTVMDAEKIKFLLLAGPLVFFKRLCLPTAAILGGHS